VGSGVIVSLYMSDRSCSGFGLQQTGAENVMRTGGGQKKSKVAVERRDKGSDNWSSLFFALYY